MNEIKFAAVNVDAKALEEQNEKFKKQKNDLQGTKKISFDPKNYLDLRLKIYLSMYIKCIQFDIN